MLNQEQLIDSFVEVELPDPDKFLMVKETLTRIGIASRHEKKLWQSCHILQKRGKYFVIHFKELFMLDGRETDFTENDLARRNTIAGLLHEWGLVRVKNLDKIVEPVIQTSMVKIIPFKDKNLWVLESKYEIGNKSNKHHS